MTVPSTTNRMDYTGNGSVSTYSFTFKVLDEADLRLTVRDTGGVETTLDLTTDYTVTGVGSPSGGSISLVNASQAWLTAGKLTSGYHLTIRNVPSIIQETDIANQGAFFAEVHEDTFDRLTIINQAQQDELDRSMKLPETLSSSDFDPTIPTTVTDYPAAYLIVNDDGDGWALGTSGGTASGQFLWGGVATGTGDAIAVTASSWAGYALGQMVVFIAAGTNTGACTLNVNSSGAKNIQLRNGQTPVAGNIVNGACYAAVYNGTVFRLLNATPVVLCDEFNGDGLTTAFTLSRGANNDEKNLHVVVGGLETLLKDRSLSGTTLTFVSPPPAGTNNINVYQTVQ